MVFKWSNLYAMRDLPVRRLLVIAALTMPLLAASFDAASRLLPLLATEDEGVLQKAFAEYRYQYNPLLFWYYIAFLFYSLFLVVVDMFVPETIRRYRDYDNFLLQTTEAAKSLGGREDRIGANPTAILQASSERWSSMNTRKPSARLAATISLFFSLLIVGFGVFVHVPSKILQHDSISRLFKDFFLISN